MSLSSEIKSQVAEMSIEEALVAALEGWDEGCQFKGDYLTEKYADKHWIDAIYDKFLQGDSDVAI